MRSNVGTKTRNPKIVGSKPFSVWPFGCFPAAEQAMPLCFSVSVHLSTVPSVQVHICCWVPGPQVEGSLSAIHVPLLVQAPNL